MNKKYILKCGLAAVSVLCLFLMLPFLPSCESREKVYKKSRITMDTIVAITVSSSAERKAEKAIDSAFDELDRLGKIFNFFSTDSEVALINRNAGIKPARVSKETLGIIEKALYASENTGGAFDISIGPAAALWDFHAKTIPPGSALKEKLKLVGYKNIIIDRVNSTVFLKKKGMMIDLGGIAKGYAADKAVEILKKSGIRSGIVAVAGDIKTFGTKPGGGLWRVGINNPRKNNGNKEIFAVVSLTDTAISTSGDYERFFVKDGIRYHHILDPKTGSPSYECRSVSVITKDGAFADSFSTGIFILGPRKGIAALKKLGFDGIIVDKNGGISVTDGLKGKIKFENDES